MPSPRPLPRSSRSTSTRTQSRRSSSPEGWERSELRQPHWRQELDADLMAMARVWQMIRLGAVRMVGEIGRQY